VLVALGAVLGSAETDADGAAGGVSPWPAEGDGADDSNGVSDGASLGSAKVAIGVTDGGAGVAVALGGVADGASGNESVDGGTATKVPPGLWLGVLARML